MQDIQTALRFTLPVVWQMMGDVFKATLSKLWQGVWAICKAIPEQASAGLDRAHAAGGPSDYEVWLYPLLCVVATVTVVGSLVIAAHLIVFAWGFLMWLIFRL